MVVDCDDSEQEELVRDCIRTLMEQEARYYQCSDYLGTAVEVQPCTPLHVILECANLVTDGTVVPSPLVVDEEAILLRSPTHVSKFPPSSRSPEKAVSYNKSNLQNLLSSSPEESQTFSAAQKRKVPLDFFQSRRSRDRASMAIWRSEMYEWATTVSELYGMDSEVISMAFSVLDRYIARELASSKIPISNEDFQLFAMVALYTMAKMVMPSSVGQTQILSIKTLIDMSDGFYSAEDIAITEREILAALQWRVNPPTTMRFCRLFLRLIPDGICASIDELERTCLFLSERSTADPYFVSKTASSTALAILLLAAKNHGMSIDETQAFVDNVQDLVPVLDDSFEAIFRRLEMLC